MTRWLEVRYAILEGLYGISIINAKISNNSILFLVCNAFLMRWLDSNALLLDC